MRLCVCVYVCVCVRRASPLNAGGERLFFVSWAAKRYAKCVSRPFDRRERILKHFRSRTTYTNKAYNQHANSGLLMPAFPFSAARPLESTVFFELHVNMIGFGLSLVDNKPMELLYAQADSMSFRFSPGFSLHLGLPSPHSTPLKPPVLLNFSLLPFFVHVICRLLRHISKESRFVERLVVMVHDGSGGSQDLN